MPLITELTVTGRRKFRNACLTQLHFHTDIIAVNSQFVQFLIALLK